MADSGTVLINGKPYDFDSLLLDEVEEIEEHFDAALEELNLGRAKVIKFVVWTFLKRDDPNVTLADVGGMRLADLMQDANGNASTPAE